MALIAKAASDLRRTLRRTHMSQTNVVNRALSLYEFVDSELSWSSRSSSARRAKSTVLCCCRPSGHLR